jgi:hypothetical protein
MQLGDHLNTGVVENFTHCLAREVSGVIAVSGNGGEEFAQHLFRGDQRSIRDVRNTGGLGLFIARHEKREPIKRVSKDPPHLFGVP